MDHSTDFRAKELFQWTWTDCRPLSIAIQRVCHIPVQCFELAIGQNPHARCIKHVTYLGPNFRGLIQHVSILVGGFNPSEKY